MGLSSYLVTLAAIVGAFALPSAEIVEDAPNFQLRFENTTFSSLMKRQNPNYNQDYIAGGANVQYSPSTSAGTFSVNFNTQGDFVVGIGWQPGNANAITYSGSFSAKGVGILAIYGWSTNPLVEYYIMEDPVGYQTAGTQKGSFTSDGATYNVWEHQQVNQPSITGTATFQQYISIRQSPRTSGTVTVQNHFSKWASLGMNLGTLNYQVLAVESWSGSGSGNFKVSKGSAGSSPAPAPTSSAPGGGSTTPPSSGGCSALYGQCGGIGFSGPTCCSSGTCKASNAYYSQCL